MRTPLLIQYVVAVWPSLYSICFLWGFRPRPPPEAPLPPFARALGEEAVVEGLGPERRKKVAAEGGGIGWPPHRKTRYACLLARQTTAEKASSRFLAK